MQNQDLNTKVVFRRKQNNPNVHTLTLALPQKDFRPKINIMPTNYYYTEKEM